MSMTMLPPFEAFPSQRADLLMFREALASVSREDAMEGAGTHLQNVAIHGLRAAFGPLGPASAS